MQNDSTSIEKLTEKAGLSTETIQRLVSKKNEDAKLSSFLAIVEACGGSVVIEMGSKQIPIQLNQ